MRKLEVIEAIGVARLLKVDLLTRADEDNADLQKTATIQEKEYDIILSEMLDAFIKLEGASRKRVLAIMKDATREIKE